ncbi:MAG: valine--tRNA ligase, partial [Candidatus Neomarinimicrobiota bacterium]
PPPNVTGILTVGHVLNNTIQDILIRRARMQGHSTLWLPGTDHASIATEAKIVRQFKEQGQDKHTVGREKFLEAAWDWADNYGGAIIEQLKRLGCSCDWSRTAFTMDEGYYNSVIEVFVRLYADGLIYRGERLINWDPVGKTALSDEEVIHKQTNGHLWYFRYPLKDTSGHLTVATTRPETMLGDTGVAVNPKDKRFANLIGQTAVLPLVGRELPIFADDFVDPEFGTGAVKVTPAHDPNDYQMGQRHSLEVVNIFHPDASLNDNVPEQFRDMDRFEARQAVVAAMEAQGLVEKVEDHEHNVGYSERTNAMVEPYLSLQWFLRMPELARPALEAVDHGRIVFFPDHWVKVYDHWMENIHDWCISRQLWWGHRIPAWYGPEGETFVARTEKEALEQARDHYGKQVELRQDEDVLDTWFSSWLWPLSTLGWPDEDSPDLKRFYPAQALVTGPDIIFFWVARMIMAGLRFQDDIPFDTVYFTGMVRDKQGRKMSKSLGNSPDPLAIIDQYGADALRMGMMLIAPQGQDVLFSEENIEIGRNYMNKIWNAARFVLMNLDDEFPTPLKQLPAEQLDQVDRWILSRLDRTLQAVEQAYKGYRINEVAKTTYDFVWGDYCDWYLEFIKTRLQGDDLADRKTAQAVAVHVLRNILAMLHPFAPFISEELWQQFKAEDEPDLIVAPWPVGDDLDVDDETGVPVLKAVISAVRSARSDMNVDPGKRADLMVRGPAARTAVLEQGRSHLERLGKVGTLEVGEDITKPPHCATAVVEGLELFIPLEGLIDLEVERERLTKRLGEAEGRLTAVEKKLGNDNFLKRAPEAVVAHEREKQAAHRERLEKLREHLAALA